MSSKPAFALVRKKKYPKIIISKKIKPKTKQKGKFLSLWLRFKINNFFNNYQFSLAAY